MAKAQGTKAPRTVAHPRSNEAEQLAALRWLAMEIEQVSIEVFITNRRNFGAVEEALRLQVKLLRDIARSNPPLVSEECPSGYVPCGGLCSPMCDGELPQAVARKRRA
jgi:hypothetical protein